MNAEIRILALMVVTAWLFCGCIAIDGFGTPTPTPTPAVTATPVPTPSGTPTPEPLRCPASCDDGNPCTVDDCGARTNFECEHIPMEGPRSNCTGAAGNCTEFYCAEGICRIRPAAPCCGNGVCEQGEGCACPDCTCGQGQLCCGNECRAPACTTDAECIDPNVCTRDTCANAGTCDAVCTNEPKGCFSFDSCCPDGCDFLTDNDCPAYSKGQWAITSTNVSVRIDELSMKRCLKSTTGRDENWLVLRITLKYEREGSAYFSPSYITLIDEFIGATLTYTDPIGTDCYAFDSDFLLTAGNVQADERVGLVYFYYGDRTMSTQSKKIVVNTGSGPRLIWLVSPSG